MRFLLQAFLLLLAYVTVNAAAVEDCFEVKTINDCALASFNCTRCMWCTSAAVPAACVAEWQAERLPPSTFQCSYPPLPTVSTSRRGEPVPYCGGQLASIYRKPGDAQEKCSFVQIGIPDGQMKTINSVKACADVGKNPSAPNPAPARTAYSQANHQLYFVTGSGENVYSYDVWSGEEKVFATLPLDYDFVVGLYASQNALFMITTTTIYSVPLNNYNPSTKMTKIASIAHLGFDETVISSGDENNNKFFIASQYKNSTIYVFDGSSASAAPLVAAYTVKGLPDQAMDLQYSSDNQAFIILASYQLFSLPLNTLVLDKIMDIPNGPGFPRINTLFQNNFIFADFTKLYIADINTGSITATNDFVSTGCQGYFQFYY